MKLFSQVFFGPHVASLFKFAGPTALVAEKQQDAPAPSSSIGITNWEGGVTYRPVVVVKPQTIDDVVRVVTDTLR